MSRIFLSHSSQDNAAAIALRDWLKTVGWDDAFLDLDPSRGIAAGERWERALHAAATRCEAVLFLISTNWLGSGWCDKEYALAKGLNKKLFALLIDANLAIADLPPKYTGTWQVVDLAGGQDLRLFRATLPSSHEEVHVGFAAQGLARLKRGLEKAGLDPKFFAWPPENDPNRAPYRGLKPLDIVDAGVFFGRDAAIVEATDRLRGLKSGAAPRLLAILGASGAGKSSFLRAGLWPRLHRDDAQFLPLPMIRPERAAISGENGLIAALTAVFPRHTRADLRAAVQEGKLGVLLAELAGEAFRRTLADAETGRPAAILIAVDQAEELFRPEGAAEGEALLALLRELTLAESPVVIVVFAIRSDSYDALETAKSLEGLAQSALPLLPMPRAAYKELIERPASRFVEAGGKLDVEPKLIQRLIADLDFGAGSDALPLLAFTLEQLFLEFGAAGALRLMDYEAFGGVKGAIDAAVARAFQRAEGDRRIPQDRAAREALLRRGLVPWLAGIDPESRTPRRNIARRADIPEEARPLIELLIEERLLSVDVQETEGGRIVTIEPAHEALLRQWGLLQGWLAEDFALLAALESVKRAARDWNANGRSEAWLAHQGQRLAEAQALDARPDIAARLDAIDRAYLAGCRTEEDRRRAERDARHAAEQKAAQRTRIGLAAALVLALIAGGGGVLAWTQKQAADRASAEAQRQRDAAEISKKDALAEKDTADRASVEAKMQRDRAEAALADAKAQRDAAEVAKKDAEAQSARAARAVSEAVGTANGLIFEIVQRFRNFTGVPASTIEAILDQALKLQDSLLGTGETDPDLRRSQSAALDEAADTLLSLGDTAKALAAAQKSLAIMQALVGLQPGNAGWQDDLSLSYDKVGDVQAEQGDLADALKSYRDSLTIRERLAQSDPGNAGGQRDLSASYDDVGEVYVAQGDLAGALKSYRDSLAIRERLAQSDPGNAGWQRDLSVSYNEVGGVLVAQGDLAGALKSYSDSLTIRERLAQSDPGNAGWQRDLSVSYEKVGDVQDAQGDLAGALKSYSDDLAIADRLAQSDPGNAGWEHDLSVAYDRVGNVSKAQGDLAGALKSYRDSLAIRERLAQSDPGNAGWQRDLSVSCNEVGGVQEAQGDLADALKSYRDGLAIRELLAQSDPGNAGWQRDLSVSHSKLGDLFAKQGKIDDALNEYRVALDLAERLAAIDFTNVLWKSDVIEFNYDLAVNGDDSARRFVFIAERLRQLKAQHGLNKEQTGWLAEADAALSKLKPQ
jgi:tetratricopeptide (TPR) repeat protein